MLSCAFLYRMCRIGCVKKVSVHSFSCGSFLGETYPEISVSKTLEVKRLCVTIPHRKYRPDFQEVRNISDFVLILIYIDCVELSGL